MPSTQHGLWLASAGAGVEPSACLEPFMSSAVGRAWQMSCRAGMATSGGPQDRAPSPSQARRSGWAAQRAAQERGRLLAACSICTRPLRRSHCSVHGTALVASPLAAARASCQQSHLTAAVDQPLQHFRHFTARAVCATCSPLAMVGCTIKSGPLKREGPLFRRLSGNTQPSGLLHDPRRVLQFLCWR